ncbi:unnamed protein product [Caenorhabditis angaria]|uniref:Tyrosine-protein phosphatase domain-containing protein n=1 Tax=Caenorhabditis angaria TaxID=860376 RepID=A0A9P1IDQ1_9PELO|nr:unnamed protein product [Caenorhabditis angaria]
MSSVNRRNRKDEKSEAVKAAQPKSRRRSAEKAQRTAEKTQRLQEESTIIIDWNKDFNMSVDKKMKEFVEKMYKIETETKLSTHFLNNLMNMASNNQKYTKYMETQQKNRNPDVFCLETTRVKLKGGTDGQDYIHANYITVEKAKKAYIATQHPMASTIEDFWNMVVNEEIELIVSLTNLVGPDFPSYFPTRRNSFTEYGSYQIICKNNRQTSLKYSPQVLTLEIVQEGCANGWSVILLKYPHWAKGSVPTSPKVVMTLMRMMSKVFKFAPIVIHCETGVNQSAVLIYTDLIYNLLLDNQTVDIDEIFQSIRKQRVSMLSQRIHFVYSIYVVLEFIKIRFIHNKTMPEVVKMIETMEKTLEPEFSKFISPEPSEPKYSSPGPSDLMY